MLYEILYASHASKDLDTSALTSLAQKANHYNSNHDITGALWFDGEHFVQILEGPPKTVMALFDHIKSDKRHHGLLKFYAGYRETRIFSEWSTSFLVSGKSDGLTDWKTLRAFVKNNAIDENFSVNLLNELFDALLPRAAQ